MANSWFQFKQFLVRQEHAAMKVTTDACLFGAWVAEKMLNKPVTRVLDIGAGTGLLSLMLAQKIPVPVDAVEIDEAAFKEASGNTSASIFNRLVSVHHSDITFFDQALFYDLIISNPPFFEGSLRSPSIKVNLARHETELALDQLFVTVRQRLSANGHFALLLPYTRLDAANELAAASALQPICTCAVRQTEKHDFFRVMIIYGAGQGDVREQLTIKEDGRYSSEFTYLLKDYYLQF
jgi:tRNA1Val (adenine37-N6)-methyltransferase